MLGVFPTCLWVKNAPNMNIFGATKLPNIQKIQWSEGVRRRGSVLENSLKIIYVDVFFVSNYFVKSGISVSHLASQQMPSGIIKSSKFGAGADSVAKQGRDLMHSDQDYGHVASCLILGALLMQRMSGLSREASPTVTWSKAATWSVHNCWSKSQKRPSTPRRSLASTRCPHSL